MPDNDLPEEPAEAELMQAYQQLDVYARHMAELAKNQQWQALADEQTRYVKVVANLRQRGVGALSGAAGTGTRFRLLDDILARNRETYDCLIERRRELAAKIAQTRTRHDLGRAYGPGTLTAVDGPDTGAEKDSS